MTDQCSVSVGPSLCHAHWEAGFCSTCAESIFVPGCALVKQISLLNVSSRHGTWSPCSLESRRFEYVWVRERISWHLDTYLYPNGGSLIKVVGDILRRVVLVMLKSHHPIRRKRLPTSWTCHGGRDSKTLLTGVTPLLVPHFSERRCDGLASHLIIYDNWTVSRRKLVGAIMAVQKFLTSDPQNAHLCQFYVT